MGGGPPGLEGIECLVGSALCHRGRGGAAGRGRNPVAFARVGQVWPDSGLSISSRQSASGTSWGGSGRYRRPGDRRAGRRGRCGSTSRPPCSLPSKRRGAQAKDWENPAQVGADRRASFRRARAGKRPFLDQWPGAGPMSPGAGECRAGPAGASCHSRQLPALLLRRPRRRRSATCRRWYCSSVGGTAGWWGRVRPGGAGASQWARARSPWRSSRRVLGGGGHRVGRGALQEVAQRGQDLQRQPLAGAGDETVDLGGGQVDPALRAAGAPISRGGGEARLGQRLARPCSETDPTC